MKQFCLFLTILAILQQGEAIFRNKKGTLYVFGDSISDNGNMYRYSSGAFPLHSEVASSNYVWNVYAANMLKMKLLNNAFVGAGVNPRSSFHKSLPMPTLSQQILNYKLRNVLECEEDTCIYAILIGANDLKEALRSVFNPFDFKEDFATDLTGKVKEGIESLLEKGPKTIVVANFLPLSKFPIGFENGDTIAKALGYVADRIEKEVNEKYVEILAELREKYADSTFLSWDLRKPFERVESMNDYTLEYCVQSNGEKCDDPSKFYWWDVAHPNDAIHHEMALSFVDLIDREVAP